MSFTDVIKKSVLEGFTYSDFSTVKILVTLFIAYGIALYIHMIYKLATKNAFYYKNYAISMTIMSVVTAGIIMAMQSSIVISLGMVGALSIVRFRTAIKDPMDLLFLFWSIANGIICGAGLYEMAIMVSLVATVGIFAFQMFPVKKGSYLLVINTDSKDLYAPIIDAVKATTTLCIVKSKNVGRNSMELVLEIKLKDKSEDVMDKLFEIEGVDNVNLLENNTDVKS